MEEIVAFTVCINYSDYLEDTLQHNRYLFKDFWVITEEDDIKTIDLAKKHNCSVHLTKQRKANGAIFNKSAMIRDLQHILHSKYNNKWICYIDADCYISNSFSYIDLSKLNKNYIYGLHRSVYESRDEFISYLDKPPKKPIVYRIQIPTIVNQSVSIPNPRHGIEFRPRQMATQKKKIVYVERDAVSGYFQLYYDKTKYYAPFSLNCAKCDIDFAKLFEDQVMLKDAYVSHFGPICTNWDGRTSSEWK
jgi:hypothetical protein